MKTLTWQPATISVADSGEGTVALILEDPGETVVIPLVAGDARRIGLSLLNIDPDSERGRDTLTTLGLQDLIRRDAETDHIVWGLLGDGEELD